MALPTILNNQPSAGFISWSGFGVQYDGVGYEVPAGNTDKKFTWWKYAGGADWYTTPSGWTSLNLPESAATTSAAWAAYVSPASYVNQANGFTVKVRVRLSSATPVGGIIFGGNASNTSNYALLIDARNDSGSSASSVHLRNGPNAPSWSQSLVTSPGLIQFNVDYDMTLRLVGSSLTAIVMQDATTIYSGTVSFTQSSGVHRVGVCMNGTGTFGNLSVIPSADTMPDLAPEDCLLFLNRGGLGILAPTAQVVDGSLIVSGTILGDAIGANQIDATHVKANAITATQIAANAVGAEQLTAGAVTTEKLSVAAVGDNKIANGSFEDGVEGWTVIASGAGATADVVTGVASSGANALRLMPGAASGLYVGQKPEFYIPVTATASRQWYVACRAGAATSGSGFYLRVYWYKADKTPSSTTYTSVAENATVGTTWNVYEAALTPPADARYMRIQVINNRLGSTMYVDEIVAHEVVISAMIGDGQITTPKLVANAVTADKVAAGSVKAQHLAVGVGDTGQRLELTGSGMRVFDPDGEPVISFGTASDDVFQVSQKNASGELVPVANIDENGDATFQNAEISYDVNIQGSPLVGSFASDPTNGQGLGDIPMLDRIGRGIVAVGLVGNTTYSAVSHVTAALAIGSVELIAGRAYQWSYEGGPYIATWASGSGNGNLLMDIYVGTGAQSVGSPNSTDGWEGTSWVLASRAAVDADYTQAVVTFGTFSVSTSRAYNVLLRLRNTATSRTWTFGPSGLTGNPARIVLRDVGPAGAWSVDQWESRATSGSVSPPAGSTTKTAVFNATWSQAWNSSGSTLSSSSSLYSDGRMLQGGNTGNRAGCVGFPALGLSGKTITGMWIRVKNRHTYSSSGATVDLGTHGNSSAPGGSAPNSSNTFTKKITKGQDLWIAIPSGLWAGFAAGTYRGIQFGGPNVNTGTSDYAIFDGYDTTNATGTSRVRPQLKVSYKE